MRFGLLILSFSCLSLSAQKAENLIIITTDGLRWQEVFKGMDTALANNKKFNEGDSTYLYKNYFESDAGESRKKLMPFLWSVVAQNGQLYGNRTLGNKVNNTNPYWFSYPGYSEIFTGHVDSAVNSNNYPPNPNKNVLAFLQEQAPYKNKIAAFGAWEAFDRILNEQASGIPVISAFDNTAPFNPSANQKLIDAMLADSYRPWHEDECLDVFTHAAAMNYLTEKKPRIIYIAYGETDEWAHAGKYRSYLDAANQVDKWIERIWNYVQQDPAYKNKTALLITTDHGRGDIKKNEWTSHGSKIAGANEIWMALLGPGIPGKGEVKQSQQLFQQQTAQTIASILGFSFTTKHTVAPAVPYK